MADNANEEEIRENEEAIKEQMEEIIKGEAEAEKAEQVGRESTSQTDAESQLQETAKNKEYLFLKGKFTYGGRNKTYGLLSCIFDKETQELVRLDLLEKDENFEFRLESSLRSVAEFYRNQLTNYRSKQMAEKLSTSLTRNVIGKIFTEAQNDNLAAIKLIFQEKLEDIQQESIKFELEQEIISQRELEKIYPELFAVDEEEETEAAEAEEGLDRINEFSEEESGLDAQIELKCTPIISAIRGRRISQLDSGEKILVNISDKRSLGQDLRDLLERRNGAAVGTIEEIKYNEELDRYRVLVKFKRNIYGSLVVDPEVKITVIDDSEPVPTEESANLGFKLDQDIILLFGGIGLIVIFLIVIFLII